MIPIIDLIMLKAMIKNNLGEINDAVGNQIRAYNMDPFEDYISKIVKGLFGICSFQSCTAQMVDFGGTYVFYFPTEGM